MASTCLASASTNARITCLCTVQKQQPKQQAKGGGVASAGLACPAGGDKDRPRILATNAPSSKLRQTLTQATEKAQGTHISTDLAQPNIKTGSK